MGTLADETGCITQGKLVWTDQAWSELFFPANESNGTPSPLLETADEAETSPAPTVPAALWRELAMMETNGLRVLEEKILYARFMLTFG
ncbi:uncharacterized protein ColSpa_10544 [Colletotrichum spaethianum]|uniref:Uncharacterized protein n=1 Tax=Colletotrichum spaethianum TaxID=700344 RepID=A0AA37PDN3_9PEZI|nr:uncharacterized protein ColSpa_10544 [Colletotrichum spaethianum]GKT50363.1 hypothetical protein ColSpa_10544 [Colletotrichum spaethianum]